MKIFVFAFALVVCFFNGINPTESNETDIWEPFRPLIGKWTGERTGMGGDATQTTEWKFVLGGKFLQCSTRTIKGNDPHADIGMVSYDQQRQKFIYRLFFSEGYVNQYVGTLADDGKTIEFVTEAVENGPPGMRVMEIWTLQDGELKVECLLASGDQSFKSCVVARMKRSESRED